MSFLRLFYYHFFLAVAPMVAAFDCNSVEFCSRLRHAVPSSIYIPNEDTFQILDGNTLVQIQLVNADNPEDKLTLAITSYEAAFRVTIKEVNSLRYDLDVVLKDDLEPTPIDSVNLSNGLITLKRGSVSVVLKSDPVWIEFYHNDLLQTIFNVETLIFEESDQAFKFGITFPEALKLYGLHQHSDNLALQDTIVGNIDPYRLKCLDSPNYALHSPEALNGAIPVLYGHSLTTTSGIFLHNAAEQWYDLQFGIDSGKGANVSILVESGTLDLFVLAGPRPANVVRQYQKLTGVAHMPQLWALGYHQSRNYENESDVKDVIANFDNYNFPMDVIWLDVQYSYGDRYFIWDPVAFSDPIEMQQNISASGRKLVTINDPHIKVVEDYFVYKKANDSDYFIKYENGSDFEGQCFPGLSSYLDFLNPDAAGYYSSLYSYENFNGTTSTMAGIWNDMNEPTVFNSDFEKTLPGDVVHHGGIKHNNIHNIYGFLQSKATHEGLLNRDDGKKRPFVLSRSHFAGSQRYSAIWTGDNVAHWGYLADSFSQCLTANILGISFCGANVGGFNEDPDDELLQRWYQAGAWLPFYRAHCYMTMKRREPYLYPEDIQQVIRNGLNQRYKHILYWYKLFFEQEMINGDPVIRPLFYEYPEDVNVLEIDNQLLVGKDILVRPITEPEVDEVNIYLPGEEKDFWISANDFKTYKAGGYTLLPVNISFIPVFYRSGSIVTVYDDVYPKSTEDLKLANITIYCFYDADNNCEGTFYHDDFTSFNYRNGEYTYVKLVMNENWITLTNLAPKSTNQKLKISKIISFRRTPDGETNKTSHMEAALTNLRFDNHETIIFNLAPINVPKKKADM